MDAEVVVRCFRAYLAYEGLAVSRAEFTSNLDEKADDPAFTSDVPFLLNPTIEFDHHQAQAIVRERLVALL